MCDEVQRSRQNHDDLAGLGCGPSAAETNARPVRNGLPHAVSDGHTFGYTIPAGEQVRQSPDLVGSVQVPTPWLDGVRGAGRLRVAGDAGRVR